MTSYGNIYHRTGLFFFVIGILSAVLSWSFKVSPRVEKALVVCIIFTGIFAGILNVSEDEQNEFILASSGLLIALIALNMLNGKIAIFPMTLINKLTLFISMMLLTVGLKIFFEYGAQNKEMTQIERIKEDKKTSDYLVMSPAEKKWNFLVFLAVALTFIILLLQLFFEVGRYRIVIRVLEWIITVVFIVDIVVLYRKIKDWKKFLKLCWTDVIAAIPFFETLKIFKIIRIFKISKVLKALKIKKGLKFFSRESGFLEYLKEDKKDELLKDTEEKKD